jgi:hypothetical protein
MNGIEVLVLSAVMFIFGFIWGWRGHRAYESERL